ncbi:MAG: hypothetical protein QM750_08455 [Rubrivivax sp.]
MRRAAIPLLGLLALGLAGLLAWLWLRPDGHGAVLHWQPPAPLRPALDAPAALPAPDVDLGRYVATLDRPLFVSSRRPPPPPPPASVPAVVVDTPPDLRVLGLYGRRAEGEGAVAGGTGGMIARVDGQVKRVRIGEAVGRWTLKALRPGEAVLALGDTEQVYPLRRPAPDEPPAAATADNAAPGDRPAARPAAANPQMQRQIEEARQNLRRVNALRARSGLPLLPEP